MGKGENAGYQQCFQKLFYLKVLKVWIVWLRVIFLLQMLSNRLGLKICCNPFLNKPLFLCVCSTHLFKTLWEKEKLLVTSKFSFSHTVFFTLLENFLPYSSNLRLLSANSVSLKESKICRLGKG